MGESKTDLSQLRQFINKIAKKLKLEKVILFGSRSHGTPRVDSDYDLVLVSSDFEGIKFYKRTSGLYTSWNLEAPVDFICLTPKEFEEKRKQPTVVRHAVEKGLQIV